MPESVVGIEIWGPSLWSAMHSLAFSYPQICGDDCKERVAIFKFLESLKVLIPCEQCKSHYAEWFEENIGSSSSSVLDGKSELSTAIVNFHNSVNRRIKKKEIPYEKVKAKYVTSASKGPTTASNKLMMVGGGICIVVVVSVVSFLLLQRFQKPKKRKMR